MDDEEGKGGEGVVGEGREEREKGEVGDAEAKKKKERICFFHYNKMEGRPEDAAEGVDDEEDDDDDNDINEGPQRQ